MILTAPEYVFPGTPDHDPMLWGIEWNGETGQCAVVESYDNGETWIGNCHLPTMEDCNRFILIWFNNNL